MNNAGGELRRISLLGTGVKIVSAAAHFHGFGVARQGPWVTRVKKGKSKGWAMGKPTSNSGKEKELLRR
jgi:hypothetical protein